MRTNEHAFGVDDELLYRIPVPSPVLGVGHISRALLGHSCQAPKANPLGVDYDPEEWLARLRAGVPVSDFLQRQVHEPVPPLRGAISKLVTAQ